MLKFGFGLLVLLCSFQMAILAGQPTCHLSRKWSRHPAVHVASNTFNRTSGMYNTEVPIHMEESGMEAHNCTAGIQFQEGQVDKVFFSDLQGRLEKWRFEVNNETNHSYRIIRTSKAGYAKEGKYKILLADNSFLEFVTSLPKCHLNLTNSRYPGGIYDRLVTLSFSQKTHVFNTEVTVTLQEDMTKAVDCSMGIRFEQDPEESVTFRSSGSEPLEKWHFELYFNSYYFVKHTSNFSFADVGKYTLMFADNVSVVFFNIKESHDHKEIHRFEDDEESDFSIKVSSAAFRKCVEFHQFNGSDLSKALRCGNNPDVSGSCNVSLPPIDLGSSLMMNVTVLNRTFPNFELRCSAKNIHHRWFNSSVLFSVNGIEMMTTEQILLAVFCSLSVLLCVVCVLLYLYNRNAIFNRYLMMKREPYLLRVKAMPVSIDRQITHLDDSDNEDLDESSFDGDIWPRWILEAHLMRFPRKDIQFDASKPLGCGNYGFVYNGSVKYGTASFEVAIKQAKSEDCESQDELLREAEKLSRLRDHPNVVNIKGITLETAPDGLCRKYSIILTLYTSGNLEGYLRKNRETMTLEKDVGKMKLWAYEISKGMQFLGEKGILHLDLATRNILLTHPTEICKISDFGLSKFVTELSDDCFENKGLPICWLPLDVWRTGTFANASTATDVWSFGVLLWEIFSVGALPYEKILRESSVSSNYHRLAKREGNDGG